MRVKVSDLTPSQRAELEALMDLPEDEIDTDDIPGELGMAKPQAWSLRGLSKQESRTEERIGTRKHHVQRRSDNRHQRARSRGHHICVHDRNRLDP